jgi:hypothetical protein
MSYSERNVSAMQKRIAPRVYGDLDLDITPERFRRELGENSILKNNARVAELLADPEKVEFFRQLTLMGDPLADAYAALIPELGFRNISEMLNAAIEQGIAAVKDAPPELVALMQAVDVAPDWLDLERVERAAKFMRLPTALAGDFALRVAFMNTYVNGYQGLPMIITGALTSDSAGRRMKETASTFKLAVLPGALQRGGEAYRSVLMVRLMHAMVRGNLLRKKEVWDYSVYGLPIPQVDQMGAALVTSYLLAKRALKKKRAFKPLERDIVELNRYTAYLLGMHDQFLSAEPEQIVETWELCQATLRHKFDPRGKALNDATLAAYRRPTTGLFNRALHFLDVSANKFMYQKAVGSKTAEQMGVDAGLPEALSFAGLFLPAGLNYSALYFLDKLPRAHEVIDGLATKAIRKQLKSEGAPEYKTDAKSYAM